MESRGHFEAAHSQPPPRATAVPPPPPTAGSQLTIPEIGYVCGRTAKALLEITENAEPKVTRDGKKLVPIASILLTGAASAFGALATAIAENPGDFAEALSDALGSVREQMPLSYVVMDP